MFIPVSIRIKNITTHKDTFFEFHTGKSLIVTGENLDDKGQKGNGAGKSGINECVSIAIAGETIRKVALKDLVSDNETTGEVELILFNTEKNKNLNIKRTLFSNTKPQECSIWYDEEKPIEKANVLHYSTWLFDEIGISQDDFFSFYLITKENYKPFFSLTDVPKKTIINRFSGANEIDKIDPHVKKDITVEEGRKIDFDKKIAVENAKLELYSEQLTGLTKTDEELEQGNEDLTQELEQVAVDIEQLGIEREFKNKQIEDLDKQINKFKNPYPEQIETKEKEVTKIQGEITEKKSEIKEVEVKHEKSIEGKKDLIKYTEGEYNKKIDIEKQNIQDSNDEKKEFQNEINLCISKINKLNNKLISSISCPECSHEFNLQDTEFNVEKTRDEEIPELEQEKKLFEEEVVTCDYNIKIFNQTINSYNDDCSNEIKVIRVVIEKIEEQIVSETEKIRTYIKTLEITENKVEIEIRDLTILRNQEDKKLNELNSNKWDTQHSLKQLDIQEKNLNLQFEEIEKKILTLGIVDTDKQNEIQNNINITKNKIDKLEVELQEVVDELLRLNTWLLNFKKFKSYLANRSISNITDYTNLFLQKIGSDLSINVEGYRTLSDGKVKEELNTVVLRNGLTIGKYGRFSSGERVRIDFSNILALQEICNINACNGLDLLLIDEVLDSCDATGISLMVEGTVGLNKAIMIISQNEVKGTENKIKIVKQNGKSEIIY